MHRSALQSSAWYCVLLIFLFPFFLWMIFWYPSVYTGSAMHCKLHIVYYKLYSTLYTQYTVHTVHCTHSTLKLYTVHCQLYTVHCTLYYVQCTLYTLRSTLNTTHFTLQNAHCKMHIIHCTLVSIQCTIHTTQVRLILQPTLSVREGWVCYLCKDEDKDHYQQNSH